MTQTLPTLTGTALDGTTLRLPAELPPMATVLLFGFQHEARADVGAWKRALDGAGLPWMSLPVVQEGTDPASLSGVIQAMKHHAPERDWGHTVLVHEGGTGLLLAFGWVPDASAKVVLVEPDGTVLASHAGPYSDAAVEALTSVL